MVEVGTTNRTRVSDYAAALSEQTRVLLRVHASNYRIVGFTAKPKACELAELAHRNGLVFMEDLGSGALVDLSAVGLPDELTVQQSLAAGADLATFSGDKPLGGPQAGIVVGRAELIEPMKENALLRVLRMDKLSLAALAATLRLYLPPNDPIEKVPVLRMLAEDAESVARRARRLLLGLEELPGLTGAAVEDVCYGGGGALPMVEIPTTTVRVTARGIGAGELAARLRQADPPVIARVTNGAVSLDPRTIAPEETKELLAAFRQALA